MADTKEAQDTGAGWKQNIMAEMYGVEPHKLMFGMSAERAIGKIVLQDQGNTETGAPMHMVVGVIIGDFNTPEKPSQARPGKTYRPTEMWECEIIIRPLRRFRDNEGKQLGQGAAGLLTNGGLSRDGYDEEVP